MTWKYSREVQVAYLNIVFSYFPPLYVNISRVLNISRSENLTFYACGHSYHCYANCRCTFSSLSLEMWFLQALLCSNCLCEGASHALRLQLHNPWDPEKEREQQRKSGITVLTWSNQIRYSDCKSSSGWNFLYFVVFVLKS